MKYLFVSSSFYVQDVKSRGIPVYYYKPTGVNDEMMSKGSIIMSKDFQKKVVNKLEFIRLILSFGFVTLYMDCDLILFQNPWPILSTFSSKDYDLVTQRDETLNSGFMLLFPTSQTKLLLSCATMHMKQANELDQESILFCLPRFHDLRLHLLPSEQFSSGSYFAEFHQFYWDTIGPNQYMMHNNWIIGTKNKMYRWREMRFFTEDTDEYYSSSNRSYLIVDAPLERRNRVEFLMQAAVLSRLLQRVFLVPTFPCPPSFKIDKCNLCRKDKLCYEKFQKIIGSDFRTYVASLNPFNA